jgi:hypothetical protein
MIKPVVHYKGEAKVYVWPYSPENNPTLIGYLEEVTDHPYLGREFGVRTSKIIVPPNESGQFETLNTIYEPYQNN